MDLQVDGFTSSTLNFPTFAVETDQDLLQKLTNELG